MNIRINSSKTFNTVTDKKTRLKLATMFGEGDETAGVEFVVGQLNDALQGVWDNLGAANVGDLVNVGGFLNPIGDGCYFAEVTRVGWGTDGAPFYFVKLNF